MNNTFVDIVFEGDKFSPKFLKQITGLRILPLIEWDEVATRGRYKGQKSPYGLGTLRIEGLTTDDLLIGLKSAIKYLLLESGDLKKSGVQEISLDFDNITEDKIRLDESILKNLSLLNNALNNTQSNNEPDKDYMSNSFILQFYSSLFLKDSRIKGFERNKEVKLKQLFSRVLESDMTNIDVEKIDLGPTLMLYLFKYMDEDYDKVPAFAEVLK